jgi:hypothetical protein
MRNGGISHQWRQWSVSLSGGETWQHGGGGGGSGGISQRGGGVSTAASASKAKGDKLKANGAGWRRGEKPGEMPAHLAAASKK